MNVSPHTAALRDPTNRPPLHAATDVYLVRYGAMGTIGRFTAVRGLSLQRLDIVVVRTRRGLELGEVLARVQDAPGSDWSSPADLLVRIASDDDRRLAARNDERRPRLFDAVRRWARDASSSLEILDAEELLEPGMAVAYGLAESLPNSSGDASIAGQQQLFEVHLELTETANGVSIRPRIESSPCGSGGCRSCSGGTTATGVTDHSCATCAISAIKSRPCC